MDMLDRIFRNRLRRDMKRIARSVYLRIFPLWTDYLKKELSDSHSLLDLGCGYNSPLQRFKDFEVPLSVGVELFEPYLQESKKKEIHNQYIKADIREVEFKPKAFDTVIAVDILEHLTKQEGAELLNKMEQWARKTVVITTPNGYVWQDGYDNNPLQEHKSGWTVEELRELEFKVFGINGWRKLRGYRASMKYKPAFLWLIISGLSQKVTYHCPKLSFQLLAIKRIDEGDGE